MDDRLDWEAAEAAIDEEEEAYWAEIARLEALDASIEQEAE